jgi:hypothetical protein
MRPKHLALVAAALAIVVGLIWHFTSFTGAPTLTEAAAARWPFAGLFAGSLEEPKPTAASGTMVEVCGVGQVAIDPDEPFPAAISQLLLKQPTPSLDAAVDALTTSGKPDDRAIGLYLRWLNRVVKAREAASNEACEKDRQCQANLNAIGQAAGAADKALLRAHLVSSRDGLSRSLLKQLCDPDDRDCKLGAAQRWAEADGNNALAWLAVASAALSTDRETIDRALARAAGASRAEHYYHRLGLPAASENVLAAQSFERMTAQLASMGVVASWSIDNYVALSSSCSVKEIQQPRRREDCERVLTVLFEQDSTALGRNLAAGLGGQRFGWPADKQQRIRDLMDADLEALERLGELDPKRMFGCGAAEQVSISFQDLVKHGEIGAMQRRVARSGATVEALARALRERRAVAAQRFR